LLSPCLPQADTPTGPQGGAVNFCVEPRTFGAGWNGKEPASYSVLLTEALKLVFASVALRDSHANILEEATTGICSLVHTFADFLRIHLYVLP